MFTSTLVPAVATAMPAAPFPAGLQAILDKDGSPKLGCLLENLGRIADGQK